MGILGLTGFIDKNTHLLQSHELRDTPVVIDGNNLFHHIYRAYRIESILGGDYDIYRQKILVNFKCLLKCKIKPYVVMDGAYTPDDRKLRKCIEKVKQRIESARVASKFARCKMTPLLAYDTFLQALNELEIPHVTCQFEADNEIAKLANKLKCPVISNDSDFYIFDLLYGFLPLDYVDFNPLCKRNADGSKSSPYLFCRKYQVEDFINSFSGLSRSVLPVFATLMGNDYVKPSSVNSVYTNIQVPRVCNKIKVPVRLSKVLKLIHWLDMQSEESENILESILPHVKSRKQFLRSVLSYYDVVNFEGCDLNKYFSASGGSGENFETKAQQGFAGYNGAAFPSWFLASVCKGEITPAVMNAAVLHRVIFLCQAENLLSPTAYQCSEFLRKVMYGILLQGDPIENTSASSSCEIEQGGCDYLGELMKATAQKTAYDKAIEEGVLDRCDENNDKLSSAEETEMLYEKVAGSDDDSPIDKEKELGDSKDKEQRETSSCDEEFLEDVELNGNDNEGEMPDSVKEDVLVNPPGFVSASNQKSVVKQTQIEEYQRDQQSVKKVYVEAISSLGKDQPLPSLSDIEQMSEEDRLSILVGALGVTEFVLRAFAPNLALHAMCLRMWVNNSDPRVTEHHLDCALLCSILLHMKNAGSGTHRQSSKNKLTSTGEMERGNGQNGMPPICVDVESICAKSRTCDKFKKALSNLDKYHSTQPEFDRKNRFNIEISHPYIQLQCCMFEASNLNKLLRFPVPNIKPALHINGTFLYNFYGDLITRETPYDFIEAMLMAGSDIHKLFLQFKSAILKILPSNCFMVPADGVKKRRKKKKGKKKRKMSPNSNVPEAEEKSTSEHVESAEEMSTSEWFDVNNKFSLLCV